MWAFLSLKHNVVQLGYIYLIHLIFTFLHVYGLSTVRVVCVVYMCVHVNPGSWHRVSSSLHFTCWGMVSHSAELLFVLVRSTVTALLLHGCCGSELKSSHVCYKCLINWAVSPAVFFLCFPVSLSWSLSHLPSPSLPFLPLPLLFPPLLLSLLSIPFLPILLTTI